MIKKAQQYITLFIAVLLIFILILGTSMIISSLSFYGERVVSSINSDYESLYAIVDTPIYLPFNALDITDKNIYYKELTLLNLIAMAYKENIADFDQLFLKYNNTFSLIFEDKICLEYYELGEDQKKKAERKFNECKRSKENVLLSFGKYHFKIAIEKEKDQKFLFNEVQKYLENVQKIS